MHWGCDKCCSLAGVYTLVHGVQKPFLLHSVCAADRPRQVFQILEVGKDKGFNIRTHCLVGPQRQLLETSANRRAACVSDEDRRRSVHLPVKKRHSYCNDTKILAPSTIIIELQSARMWVHSFKHVFVFPTRTKGIPFTLSTSQIQGGVQLHQEGFTAGCEAPLPSQPGQVAHPPPSPPLITILQCVTVGWRNMGWADP